MYYKIKVLVDLSSRKWTSHMVHMDHVDKSPDFELDYN